MDDTSAERLRHRNRLTLFAILTGLLVILLGLLWFSDGEEAPVQGRSVGYMVHMREVGRALDTYADENRAYPPPAQWCDVVVERFGQEVEQALRYPVEGESEGSPYAMNPHARPDSPPDVVLLFESRRGWNQFGGPELMTAERHNGMGCYVWFVGQYARFVVPARWDTLKWDEPAGHQAQASREHLSNSLFPGTNAGRPRLPAQEHDLAWSPAPAMSTCPSPGPFTSAWPRTMSNRGRWSRCCGGY